MRSANRQSAWRPRPSRRPSSPLTAARGGAPEVARRTPAAVGSAPRIALVVRIRRAQERLDSDPEASHTADVLDPLVAALAQLVRDRWIAERRERSATRARIWVLEGEE